jgi:hypothetical protein
VSPPAIQAPLVRLSASAAIHTRQLKVFFRWLSQVEEVANPAAKLALPKIIEQPVPVFSDAELTALLAVCVGRDFLARRDRAIIRILFDTGIRRAEVVALQLLDLDLDQQVMRVVGSGWLPTGTAPAARSMTTCGPAPVTAIPRDPNCGWPVAATAVRSIVWHSTDPDRMRRILLTWQQHLADPFLPRTLGRQLRRAGFDVAPPRVLSLLNAGYEATTFSGREIPVIARFVTGRDGWTAAAVDGWAEELRTLGPDYFFSLNRYVFCATRPQ